MINCVWVIIAIIMFVIVYLLIENKGNCCIEGYNNQTGRFCISCANKTINQCLECFNCGWCVDKWGNSGCIGGDHKGPYNFENCARWYYSDPWTYMMQRNKNYKCSYGPRP